MPEEKKDIFFYLGIISFTNSIDSIFCKFSSNYWEYTSVQVVYAKKLYAAGIYLGIKSIASSIGSISISFLPFTGVPACR